jgi:hypothetical protein
MPSTAKRQTVYPKEWCRPKGLKNGGLWNVAGLNKNGWLIFSGSRFNLVSQWVSAETAIDHVLAHVLHRQSESLTENPARLARKSHRMIPAKST